MNRFTNWLWDHWTASSSVGFVLIHYGERIETTRGGIGLVLNDFFGILKRRFAWHPKIKKSSQVYHTPFLQVLRVLHKILLSILLINLRWFYPGIHLSIMADDGILPIGLAAMLANPESTLSLISLDTWVYLTLFSVVNFKKQSNGKLLEFLTANEKLKITEINTNGKHEIMKLIFIESGES